MKPFRRKMNSINSHTGNPESINALSRIESNASRQRNTPGVSCSPKGSYVRATLAWVLFTQILDLSFNADLSAMCVRRAPFHQTAVVWSASQQPGWRTLAGYPGLAGFRDGPGISAQFSNPSAIAVGSDGAVYIADTENHVIRKISTLGIVSTVAGTPGVIGYRDGTVGDALFSYPIGVAVDTASNIFVADSRSIGWAENSPGVVIRKIGPDGTVSTVAAQAPRGGFDGGRGGLALDSKGNLYVADDGGSIIRKITAAGVVTTLAGMPWSGGYQDGSGTNALFSAIAGLAATPDGDLYVTDLSNNAIRKVSPAGVVSTVGTNVLFSGLDVIALDSNGDVYVANSGYILKLAPNGQVLTVVDPPLSTDTDGLAPFASVFPSGLALDGRGHLLVVDSVGTIRYGSLQVEQRPEILTQPAPLTGQIGSSITLRVTARSAQPLSYQWFVNGSPIAGATNGSLTLANLQETDAGEYRVAVSDGLGYVLSFPAPLQVVGGSPLSNWRPLASLPVQKLRGMAYGNGRYVGVGDVGGIVHSLDGIQWMKQLPVTMKDLNGIACGAQRFVAVGSGGIVLTSADGLDWAISPITAEGLPDLRGIAFDHGLFVAAGGDVNGSLWVSPDGITWSNRVLDFGVSFLALASDGRRFVAVGNTIMISTNGLDWEPANVPVDVVGQNVALAHLAWGNRTFVASEEAHSDSCDPVSGTLLVSTNGLDWADATPTNGLVLASVTYGNGLFVADGYKSPMSGNYVSSNGINFNPGDSGFAGNPEHFTFAHELFVATEEGDNYLYTSSDAKSWTPRAQAKAIPFSPRGLIQVGSRVIGWSDFGIETSTNGADWALILPDLSFSGIAYGNGILVAVGFNGTIFSSLDGGVSWTNHSPDLSTPNFLQVTFGNGIFVAVGDDGHGAARISASPDGASWQAANVTGPPGLSDVAYGDGLYVAVGTDGDSFTDRIFTSPDAQSWNVVATPPGYYSGYSGLSTIAFGNHRFVAGGPNPGALVSSDGTNWTAAAGPSGGGLGQVIFAHGLFFAATGGGLFSSLSGFDWAYAGLPNTDLTVIGAGPNSFLGMGTDGVIYQSDFLLERLGQPRWLANGQLEWSVSGAPGLNYRIEYSDDLRAWQTLTTVSNAPTPYSFTDSGALNRASRFYRLSIP
jgi:hypothetical protein